MFLFSVTPLFHFLRLFWTSHLYYSVFSQLYLAIYQFIFIPSEKCKSLRSPNEIRISIRVDFQYNLHTNEPNNIRLQFHCCVYFVSLICSLDYTVRQQTRHTHTHIDIQWLCKGKLACTHHSHAATARVHMDATNTFNVNFVCFFDSLVIAFANYTICRCIMPKYLSLSFWIKHFIFHRVAASNSNIEFNIYSHAYFVSKQRKRELSNRNTNSFLTVFFLCLSCSRMLFVFMFVQFFFFECCFDRTEWVFRVMWVFANDALMVLRTGN